MSSAEEYVSFLYSKFTGSVPLAVGHGGQMKMIYPFVYESIDLGPIGLVGISAVENIDLNEAQLFHISSFWPRKGHGSEMMKYLCSLADEYSVNISLQAEVRFGRNKTLIGKELVLWYRKFGFVGKEFMKRQNG